VCRAKGSRAANATSGEKENMSQNPGVIIPSIPLREAVLCSGCEAIYNLKEKQCPRCSDPNAWLLVDWIRAVAA